MANCYKSAIGSYNTSAFTLCSLTYYKTLAIQYLLVKLHIYTNLHQKSIMLFEVYLALASYHK